MHFIFCKKGRQNLIMLIFYKYDIQYAVHTLNKTCVAWSLHRMSGKVFGVMAQATTYCNVYLNL